MRKRGKIGKNWGKQERENDNSLGEVPKQCKILRLIIRLVTKLVHTY